ncbi:DUF4352 domain-containing protein [Streptomyces sp. ISL-1]|uniref:DUF4352 domain-containing protein n=1 Tax=Streptomyces sp. ISL-1 TaxID=2817657 RepID=UPI001BE5A558|nr:DUF4352 domain-containing protein [Streptomyces sp. ISL-1]MBT2394309.1 DUF4352 domain-containing protein [Streptomyces sp. ISL-1]
MSQHNPGQQPQPYQPPQEPKKTSAGKKVGIGCLAIVGFFVVIGVISSVAGGGDDSADKGTDKKPSVSAPKDDSKPVEKPKEEASPITIAATPTKFTPSVLHDGGEYTSVKVTITNNSEKKISVNPLYFAITDKTGEKHTQELAADKNQMDVTDLAPGEKMTGVITGKGKFVAAYVTYTDGLIGDSVKGDVK